jgi:hypothetical protein
MDGLSAQVLAASRAALSVILAGHTPVIPQLNVVVDGLCLDLYGGHVSGEVWQRIAKDEIARSDALLFLGLDRRTLGELVMASERGIPILSSLADLPF